MTECNHNDFEPSFEDLTGSPRPCPECGRVFQVVWHETYDEMTGDEDGWFELEEVTQ